MTEKNPMIRASRCEACDQPVAIRTDKNGKAYYNCENFLADGSKCKRQVRFSVTETRRLLEDVQRERASKPAPADAGAEETEDNPLKQSSATPQATPEPVKTDKQDKWSDLGSAYE